MADKSRPPGSRDPKAQPRAPTPAPDPKFLDDPTISILTAGASAAVMEEVRRKEVIDRLRGPVAQRFKNLMPELSAVADPYRAIIEDAQLLDRAFKIFESRRDAFSAFLIDPKGAPVADDSVRLSCGRSVNEVIAMAVRSGMRAFAEQYFGGGRKPPVGAALAGGNEDEQRAGLIASIASVFRGRREAATPAKLDKAKSPAVQFYEAIRAALDYAWQVQFFPIYVEIPIELIRKLGTGITRVNDVEKLQRLAGLAGEDIVKAEQVIGDPALANEMIENNVLASAAVSKMTVTEFKTVHSGLAKLDIRKKWDVFANEPTATLLGQDKRISEADIAVLADYLNMLNEYAVRIIFDLKLGRDQFVNFLETAGRALGQTLFTALFGPIPFFGADEKAVRRRGAYANFVERTLTDLVNAVKQLMKKFKHDAPEIVTECLSLVCQSRRDTIAAEVARLAAGLT